VETLWESGSLSPSSVCPVVHDGKVYTINSAGVLLCGDATTGEVVWKLRLKGTFWATPVISGNTMYVVNQDGLAQVVSLAGKGEIVATNDFAEEILGSPAVADGAIYFRSGSRLWKIAG
jgi:outer membrane protein assembly factor BamB